MTNNSLLCFAAQGDSFTTEFYANPVAIADFEKHCAQRRKYPVLLQIEFNNATREDELQVSIKCCKMAHAHRIPIKYA